MEEFKSKVGLVTLGNSGAIVGSYLYLNNKIKSLSEELKQCQISNNVMEEKLLTLERKYLTASRGIEALTTLNTERRSDINAVSEKIEELVITLDEKNIIDKNSTKSRVGVSPIRETKKKVDSGTRIFDLLNKLEEGTTLTN